MKRAFCLATLPFTLLISSCGGSATVDSADVTTTPATTTATATATTTATSATTATSKPSTAAPAGPVDQPASEVDEIPAGGAHYTPQERAYLDHLRENGLNVEGVEDQLTATGLNVCADDTITRDAVAGQLVEQRRTDMSPEVLGQLITDAARANLCS